MIWVDVELGRRSTFPIGLTIIYTAATATTLTTQLRYAKTLAALSPPRDSQAEAAMIRRKTHTELGLQMNTAWSHPRYSLMSVVSYTTRGQRVLRIVDREPLPFYQVTLESSWLITDTRKSLLCNESLKPF